MWDRHMVSVYPLRDSHSLDGYLENHESGLEGIVFPAKSVRASPEGTDSRRARKSTTPGLVEEEQACEASQVEALLEDQEGNLLWLAATTGAGVKDRCTATKAPFCRNHRQKFAGNAHLAPCVSCPFHRLPESKCDVGIVGQGQPQRPIPPRPASRAPR